MDEEQSKDQIENPTSSPINSRRMWLPPRWLIWLLVAFAVVIAMVWW